MRLTPKTLILSVALSSALGALGMALATRLPPQPSPIALDSSPAFVLAAGSDPMLLKVSDSEHPSVSSNLGNRPQLSDVIEASTPSVVQVRVQKRASVEDASEEEEDGSLLDFLKRYGVPGANGQGATPPANPFNLSPPNLDTPKGRVIPPPSTEEDPLGILGRKTAPKKNAPQGSAPRIPFPKAPAKPPISGGVGSGFFIDETGYLLTNAHVVEGAQKITLRLSDHREIEARLIGMDKRTDIALLKAEGEGQKFKPLPIGSPEKSRVGDWVLAIGSPFGLEFTATAGILSAKGRALPSDDNYIPFLQTDAAVNPGNSGGPLINERGQAIGINSQIYSRTGGYMGISFAIPIDYAIKIASKMRKGDGSITHGRIGATVQDMTRELAQAFGLSGKSGAIILAIEPGSASEKAGLKSSDIVLSADGKPISGSNEMVRLIADSDPGDKILLGIVRDGKAMSIPVTIGGSKPKTVEAEAKSTKDSSSKPTPSALHEPLGIKGRGLNDKEAKLLGVDRGIKIFETSGIAEAAGVDADDILLTVDHQAVGSIADLAKLIDKSPAGKPLALLLRRETSTRYVAVNPDVR